MAESVQFVIMRSKNFFLLEAFLILSTFTLCCRPKGWRICFYSIKSISLRLDPLHSIFQRFRDCFKGCRSEHWGFDDPAKAQGTDEEKWYVFQRVRDEIGQRIETFAKTGE